MPVTSLRLKNTAFWTSPTTMSSPSLERFEISSLIGDAGTLSIERGLVAAARVSCSGTYSCDSGLLLLMLQRTPQAETKMLATKFPECYCTSSATKHTKLPLQSVPVPPGPRRHIGVAVAKQKSQVRPSVCSINSRGIKRELSESISP